MAADLTTKAHSPTVILKIVHDTQSHAIPIAVIIAGILGTLPSSSKSAVNFFPRRDP